MRRGNPVALHKFFGEALAGFQLSRSLRWAKHWPTAAGELIDNAQLQWEFGANNDEIRAQPVSNFHDRGEALLVERNAFRVLADATITRRAVDLRNSRRLAQFPDKSVLAPPTSNNENFHKRKK